MNERSRVRLGAWTGLGMLAFTLAVFFGPLRMLEAVDWWALGFVVLAELIFAFSMPALHWYQKKSGKLLHYSGFTTVLVCYLAMTVLLALLFLLVFRERLLWLLLTELLILVVAVAVLPAIAFGDKQAGAEQVRAVQDQSFACAKALLLDLQNQRPEPQYAHLLEKLAAAAEQQESVPAGADDPQLLAKVEALSRLLEQQPEEKTAAALANQILLALKRRELAQKQITG